VSSEIGDNAHKNAGLMMNSIDWIVVGSFCVLRSSFCVLPYTSRQSSAVRPATLNGQVKRESAPFFWHLIAVSVVALMVRLIYIAQIRQSPFFGVLMGDARRYDLWASQIAAGDVIGKEVFYQAPLYPYFLGALYAVAGRSLLAVRVSQAVIGTAACVFLALTARTLYSQRAGLFAGLGLAVYAPAIFVDGLIQKSSLDLMLVCLSLWLVSGLVAEPHTRPRWFSLGAAIGALALTRENALILVAAILLWPPGRIQLTRRQRATSAGVFLLGLAIVLVPVSVRNRVVGGEWHLTTSQFGPNLYIGNNSNADGTYAALREGRGAVEYERQDATELAEHAAGRHLTPGEVSNYWVHETLKFIQSRPLEWLALIGRKAALVVNRTEFVDTESQASYEEWSPVLQALAHVGHFGVLMPLAILGVVATWHDRSRVCVYYAMALSYVASVVMFYVSARYRLPLAPFFILFAAAGVASAASFVREASRTRIAAAVVAVGVVAAATNTSLLSEDLMQAATETNLGVALHMDGNLQAAEARYRRALELQPDYAPAYVNLGMVLTALHRPEEAIAAYARAVELGSADVDLNYRLGYALLEAGRPAQAVEYFRLAIAGGRRSAEIYNNLGIALTRAGREDDAIAAYSEASRLDPSNATIRFTLGSLFAGRGKFEQAIDEFRAGVRLMPDSAEAHNNLGGALAASGHRAEAIAEFEEALRLNPNLTSARRNLDLVRTR
jgi:tetratricopeptide (TPR) repeat protein